MGSSAIGIFAAFLLATAFALPSRRITIGDTALLPDNFVGEGTNDLATAILQGYVDSEENLAFSPLGYSALLAILAEGSQGETREQLVNALHLPDDITVTRVAYRTVLERLNEKNSATKPEFRNWFYIYKNFTVEPEYRQILQENYLTEVKDVDRLDDEKKEEEPIKAPEPSHEEVSDAAMMPEKNAEEIMKPEKTEDAVKDDKLAMDKEQTNNPIDMGNMEQDVKPVKADEPIVSEVNKDEKISEEIDTFLDVSEPEEIMQVSDIEASGDGKEDGPLKIHFPIPFPEKLKLRKLHDEREAGPSGQVMTMQEEMLGDKKEEMKDDCAMKDDKMEMNQDKKEEMKDDNMGAMKDQNKKDGVEKMKDEMKESMMEAMKDDKMDSMKDDKMDTIKDKMDTPMDGVMEGMKDDKMDAMKDDKMEAMIECMKDENMEGMKDDKMDALKDDKMEAMKDDKMDAMKDDKMEAMKDDKMETMKDDKMEAMKDDKMEAMKDDKMEAMKDEKMEAIKDGAMEVMKVENMEAMNQDKMEAMKDDKSKPMEENIEPMKDDKMDMMDVNKKEEAKDEEQKDKDSMSDEMKEENIKEAMMEEKDKTEESIMEDNMKEDSIKEEALISEAMKETKRKTRDLELPRLSRDSLQIINDVTSSLSGNNIVIKNTKSNKISQILVFNALYFKGTWETPFERQREDSFYKSDTEKSIVTMMNTEGSFRVGNVPDLDSVAIELPYKGDRYALLILMPNSRTGLRQLTADLTGYSLRKVQEYLEYQDVEVCLPSFEVQTTTRSIEAFNKYGVSDIFSPEQADLSGISKDSGLYVEELVQFVTVRVDNGSAAYNLMTASNPSTRSGLSKFVADRPFLYFVRDTVDNLIVVAGKVVDPSILPNDP